MISRLDPDKSTSVELTSDATTAASLPDKAVPSRRWQWLGALSFGNASALYVFALLFLVFSLWVPQTFLTWNIWRSLLDAQAITAIVAVGLVVPLAAGALDLSVGAEVAMGAVFVAWLLAVAHLSVPAALAVTVAAGATVGLVNGVLVTKVRIDSVIATLGMSSILLAGAYWLSGGTQITGFTTSFQSVATGQWFGVAHSVYILVAVAIGIWYLMEATPLGRRIYATGGNIDAARIVGIRTPWVLVGSLALSGAIAFGAGALVSSQLADGDPTIGPGYLLPTFTAAFLGSTQFHRGRFNVLGTVLAVYVLAVGVQGLELGGAPIWIPDLFNGVALLIAVGIAQSKGSGKSFGAVRRLISRTRVVTQDSDRMSDGPPEGHTGQ
jgi:ribose transport system permease protein